MTDTAAGDILEELRDWLRDNWDPDATVGQWWTLLGKAGWSAPTLPVDSYGRGVERAVAVQIGNEISAFGALGAPGGLGLLLAAPTIADEGTPEQIEKYVGDIVTGRKGWCQLFSEPGAGSDLAGLACRAERDGDEWIINGQKVWNTGAHLADRGMHVTRTDPSVPKHKGMTYFALDMAAPGVEVRPLRQITGEAEFNEVYFTDARVPDDQRMSDEGDGWRVSLTTLMNERVMIGGGVPKRGSGTIAQAVKAWEKYGHDDPSRKDELMQLWVRAETARLTSARSSDARKAGNPGPEGSTGKLLSAELNKDIMSFVMDLMGPEGMLYGDYTMDRSKENDLRVDPRAHFLRSRANSIEGGTSEIQRNIIGERVLGLPGEPRTDKDVAWKDVPRS